VTGGGENIRFGVKRHELNEPKLQQPENVHTTLRGKDAVKRSGNRPNHPNLCMPTLANDWGNVIFSFRGKISVGEESVLFPAGRR